MIISTSTFGEPSPDAVMLYDIFFFNTFSVALALDLDLPHILAPDPGPALAALRGAGRLLVSNYIISAVP